MNSTLPPEDATNYIDRGYAYYENNELDMAITDFDKAIQLKPEDANAYFGRGLVHSKKEDYNKDTYEK